jgi:hypothetical protein
MPKHQSRVSENKREYEGESRAMPFINWLNSTKDGDPAKDRILDIVYCFLSLNQEAESIFVGDQGYREKQSMKPVHDRNEWLEAELQSTLNYYTIVPHVVFAPQGFAITWKVAPGSDFEREQKRIQRRRKGSPSSKNSEIEEVEALTTALELFKNGLILKVDRCRCGEFYFVKFQHQRSCSSKCRTAKYKSSDEARLKRNEYARKLYHLHKSGKVK